jgi:hypothetical protein
MNGQKVMDTAIEAGKVYAGYQGYLNSPFQSEAAKVATGIGAYWFAGKVAGALTGSEGLVTF